MKPRTLIAALLGVALLGAGSLALAHYCSNIFTSRARFIVKAEQTTVHVGDTPATLRVYLQNNFPYKLFGVQMQGVAEGYDISVEPSEQDIYPGEYVTYTFTITAGSAGAGDLDTNAFIQVKFRLGDWRGTDDAFVAQRPNQEELAAMSRYGEEGEQGGALSAGTFADLYPTAKLSNDAPTFGRTALQQLAHYFGYRFCYSGEGAYACYSQDCPSPCADLNNPDHGDWSGIEQFPQHCLRAGAELAARKSKLGSSAQYARDAALNALKHSSGGGGSPEHKCLAALVGGYLWQGDAQASTFADALADSANAVPKACQNAGLRVLEGGSQLTCPTSPYYAQAVCAGAEGLRGNTGPVTNVLMAKAGDGDSSGSYSSLYYSYVLYIVQAHYKATTNGGVPFYNMTSNLSQEDSGSVTPAGDGATGTGDGGSSPTGDGPGAHGDSKGGSHGADNSLNGGCACNASSGAPQSFLLGALLLLGLALWQRPRRR